MPIWIANDGIAWMPTYCVILPANYIKYFPDTENPTEILRNENIMIKKTNFDGFKKFKVRIL